MTKKRGRPSITPGQRSTTLAVAVPPDDFDALTRLAAARGVDFPVYMRRLIRRHLSKNKLPRGPAPFTMRSIQHAG